MRSARVVVREPVWRGGIAGVVGGVGLAVCPLAAHGLAEALDLTVRLRSVRLDLEVADVLVSEQRCAVAGPTLNQAAACLIVARRSVARTRSRRPAGPSLALR